MTPIRLFALLFGLVFGVLLVRLFFMQVVDHDVWLQEAAHKQVSMDLLPYQRGRILDSNGRIRHLCLFQYRLYRHPS